MLFRSVDTKLGSSLGLGNHTYCQPINIGRHIVGILLAVNNLACNEMGIYVHIVYEVYVIDNERNVYPLALGNGPDVGAVSDQLAGLGIVGSEHLLGIYLPTNKKIKILGVLSDEQVILKYVLLALVEGVVGSEEDTESGISKQLLASSLKEEDKQALLDTVFLVRFWKQNPKAEQRSKKKAS